MRSELLLIEKIELYLEGKLNPGETALFEKQMLENPDLQAEVEMQKQIMGGIQRSLIKKDIASAFIKYKKIALLLKLGIISSSSIILGVGIVVLFNHLNTKTIDKPIPTTTVPSIKIEAETKDTVINFTDSTIAPGLLNVSDVSDIGERSKISEVNTENQPQTKASTIVEPENNPKPSEELSEELSANTSATNEQPTVTNRSAEVSKSSPFSPMSEKQKKARISKFFLDPEAQITWLGIDFSEVRLSGSQKDEDKEESEKISTTHFREWNELVLAEKKRYDISGALRHKKVLYHTNYVTGKNDTIQVGRLFTTDKFQLNHLNSDNIQRIVNAYPLESKEGYGLVFIVESLDKLKKETNTWVTLVDMKTRQVLITEKMYANAGGLGLRNYWARGFHNTINDIKERKYPEWKSKYKK
ncbi:MAG: hypothetical protein V4608_15015 [Bacteroidota bacterium]